MAKRLYLCIDLKSFYASVECIERGLDAMRTHLVVADASRTEKTICLAVSPSLRALGVPGRARLFEAVQQVRRINAQRRRSAPGGRFSGSSCNADELAADPSLELAFHVATPRMAHYIRHSTRIYDIYLRHVAPEDIHVYSIDEVFMDITHYLGPAQLDAEQFARRVIRDVYAETGITATAGIGTNLFLAKVAMDIVAKHIPADENGVRMAYLDEAGFRKNLWSHRPLTDFWRVGRGYARKLEEQGIYTMGDIARCSVGRPEDYYNEELLYRLFGVNAELLIDHAWGWEPCTIADIKAYRPQSSSVGSGQVLHCPYTNEKARLVVREMADALALDLVEKGLAADQLVLTVGYDIENLSDPARRAAYKGEVTTDGYGRSIPKHAHGSVNLGRYTCSAKCIVEQTLALFERITQPQLLVRRLNLVANRVLPQTEAPSQPETEQLDLFTDYAVLQQQREETAASEEREKRRQQALLDIKRKFGKNAILKGADLQEGATAKDRNDQIGGHRA